MNPELLVDVPCNTGENPLWHPGHESLYWCDIPPGHLFRYNPVNGKYSRIYDAGRAIGGFTIQADGSFLLFEAGGRIEQWNGGETKTIISGIPDEASSRFNDVIADPEGRVFAGTMPTESRLGRLYCIDTDGSYEIVEDGLNIPNGMAFTRNLATLYVVESEAHTIHQYDYNRQTGSLSNPQIFYESEGEPGVPDGLTIDANGDIWCARWGGNALYHYGDDGSMKDMINFPVQKVASATFGGPNYRELYVTTADGDLRESESSYAGSLFKISTNSQGRKEFRSRIEV